jgi:hypothetical protein
LEKHDIRVSGSIRQSAFLIAAGKNPVARNIAALGKERGRIRKPPIPHAMVAVLVVTE